MAHKRPQRDQVEALIREQSGKRAYEIAEEVGLIEEMGYDGATTYVKSVRRSMRKKGEISEYRADRFAPDADRLDDLTTLFQMRRGKMRASVARTMLLLNCYYRLRSEDYEIHWFAIDNTYEMAAQMQSPIPLREAIDICSTALERYMDSRDEAKTAAANQKGLPNAGLNYTTENLIRKLEITDDEMGHLKTIKKQEE